MAGDVPRKDKGKAKMAEDVEERAAVEELLGDEKVPGEQEEEASVPAPELTEEEVRDQFIDRLKTVGGCYSPTSFSALTFSSPSDPHSRPEASQLPGVGTHHLHPRALIHSRTTRLAVGRRICPPSRVNPLPHRSPRARPRTLRRRSQLARSSRRLPPSTQAIRPLREPRPSPHLNLRHLPRARPRRYGLHRLVSRASTSRLNPRPAHQCRS